MEYKFFDSVAADEAGYEGSASILIQGIADCVLEENGKGVIIDFKTDAVASPEILVERYAGQLALYKRAPGGVFPEGIAECIPLFGTSGQGNRCKIIGKSLKTTKLCYHIDKPFD